VVYTHDRWKGENVATAEVESIIINIIGLKDAAVYGVQVNIQLLTQFQSLHLVPTAAQFPVHTFLVMDTISSDHSYIIISMFSF
jgi:hypothetical protein